MKMYTHPIVVEEMMRERQRELLAEAERYRLVKKAQKAAKIYAASTEPVNVNMAARPAIAEQVWLSRYAHLVVLDLARVMTYFGK